MSAQPSLARMAMGAFLAAALLAGGLSLRDGGQQERPRQATAQAQLEDARQARLAMRRLRGGPRDVARTRAVEAYRAVCAHWPEEQSLCAEASFREGELLRAGDLEDEARAAFQRARDLGGATDFRARGELELGHIERREGRLSAALDAYAAVAADASARRCYRDDAAAWCGTVWQELGRNAEARRVWQRLSKGAEDPVDRVRAYDALASLSIFLEDLEAAAGTLQECREALADVALEETELGNRVRRALMRMSSLDELRRAVAARFERTAMGSDG